MFRHIEKLRQKPEHVRRSVALFTTLALFLVVVFVWFLTLDIPSVKKEKEQQEISATEVPSPFAVIRDSFRGFGDSVGEAGRTFKEFKEQFSDGN